MGERQVRGARIEVEGSRNKVKGAKTTWWSEARTVDGDQLKKPVVNNRLKVQGAR
jgi:hypothetical protein